jgi:carbamoyltransferase
MRIVGFQSGAHDVAYCILENGVPIIHEELERLIRIKEPKGDGLKLYFDRVGEDLHVDNFAFGNPMFAYPGEGAKAKQMAIDCYNKSSSDAMGRVLAKSGGKIHEIGHHQSHAANAFFSSNFDEALIITIDGGGVDYAMPHQQKEGTHIQTACTVWKGEKNKIYAMDIMDAKLVNIGSPWRLYTREIFGLSSGYPKGNQVGTVMALACVGNPDKYFDEFYYGFSAGGGGHTPLTKGICEKYRNIVQRSEQDKYDVAAAIQKATEISTFEFMDFHIKQGNYKNLCLSGGVALNCLMVGKMLDWWPELNIYVDPVPYDGGLAIGCARYLWHHVFDNPRIKWSDNSSPYLGTKYDSEDIENAINQSGLTVKKATDDEIVKMLCDQKIVSVFGGGSESGRRALGNRSIIADPRYKEMKNTINEKVKHRQWFRPFAPAILSEETKNWFEKDVNSPYMSFAIPFKKEVRDKVEAVVHFDGTGRLQTVSKNDNKWFHGLISKFKEKTGVPVLLNTSFNDREPIVETPSDAIKCFMGTDIDVLYFFDVGLIVEKK